MSATMRPATGRTPARRAPRRTASWRNGEVARSADRLLRSRSRLRAARARGSRWRPRAAPGTRSSAGPSAGSSAGRASSSRRPAGPGPPQPAATETGKSVLAELVLRAVAVPAAGSGDAPGRRRGSATARSRARPTGRTSSCRRRTEAAGAGHPQHLVGQAPRLGHVLEHVGREADVDGVARNGSRMPSPITVRRATYPARTAPPRRRQARDRSAPAARTRRGSSPVHPRRPATRTPRDRGTGQLADRVGGQRRVEAPRVVLFVPEVREQPHRPTQGRRPASWGVSGTARHAPTLSGRGSLRGDYLLGDDFGCASLNGRRISMLSWRDTRNPEGGGAERYLEQMAGGLVARGCHVTVFCAAHAGAPPARRPRRDGFVRRGTKLSVYLHGMRLLAAGRLGTWGGATSWSTCRTACPSSPAWSRGSRSSCWSTTCTASSGRWSIPASPGASAGGSSAAGAPALPPQPVRRRLAGDPRPSSPSLGVDPARVAVVHNGTDLRVDVDARRPRPEHLRRGAAGPPQAGRARDRRDARAAAGVPRPDPHRRGQWLVGGRAQGLRRGARSTDAVEFAGHVDELRKQEVYERSWVMALPSLKEGWGLVVGEAAMHGTPTVAYRAAGGTRESIDHGVSGLLADDYEEFVDRCAACWSTGPAHSVVAGCARGAGGSPGDRRARRSRTWSESTRAGEWSRRTRERGEERSVDGGTRSADSRTGASRSRS